MNRGGAQGGKLTTAPRGLALGIARRTSRPRPPLLGEALGGRGYYEILRLRQTGLSFAIIANSFRA